MNVSLSLLLGMASMLEVDVANKMSNDKNQYKYNRIERNPPYLFISVSSKIIRGITVFKNSKFSIMGQYHQEQGTRVTSNYCSKGDHNLSTLLVFFCFFYYFLPYLLVNTKDK
ncbi:hypothetical protein LOAG_06818 [Loa loa]|uniref:Uncharacterized protein n=1 Tax=Loa loa TaxID=7209 RepID=A0A1S0TWW9_LOALO|nr:hypothetical protein LOAG_06818 [Loa loa]EFO21665.1 hypothetical protein LOAG_06818 [Loa loa]